MPFRFQIDVALKNHDTCKRTLYGSPFVVSFMHSGLNNLNVRIKKLVNKRRFLLNAICIHIEQLLRKHRLEQPFKRGAKFKKMRLYI